MNATKVRILIMRLVLSVLFAIGLSRFFPFLLKGIWATAGMATALFVFAYLLEYARNRRKAE